MKIGVVGVSFLLMLVACSPRALIKKEVVKMERELRDHMGFALYDPTTKKTLIEYQSEKYFTPASNTKIFTLYAALNVLGDSSIALKYEQRNDSVIFWGMGDPSFLYGDVYDNGRTYNFLSQIPGKLFYSSSNFMTERLGPGWSWGDYKYSYSPERTPLPLYGNLLSVEKISTGFNIRPYFFNKHFTQATEFRTREEIVREQDSNQLTYFPGLTLASEPTWSIPYHYSSDLLVELLSDTLKRSVEEINWTAPPQAQVLHAVPLDSIYKVMMQVSDNFIAEQLLLQCAAVLSDTLKPEIAIKYVKKYFMADLPDEPRWVDGSGLSRYNLFTPRSIVRLWEKIYVQVPRDRLFHLLAVGGVSGTIENWYKAESPYIYGKTGSLSNNHCLSGYLVTKKGKTLIFSIMNNNFLASSVEVRTRMEEILKTIRDRYQRIYTLAK